MKRLLGVVREMMKTVHLLHPFRLGSEWVFDDARLELIEEPFVDGMSEMVDLVCAHHRIDADHLVFEVSGKPFEGYMHWIRLMKKEAGGGWYGLCLDNRWYFGWLCPVTRLYFGGRVPKRLYIRISVPSQGGGPSNTLRCL